LLLQELRSEWVIYIGDAFFIAILNYISNILLDLDWDCGCIIRICDFTHALLADGCGNARSDQMAELTASPSMEPCYTAPEFGCQSSPNSQK
jgi:hypothetical protein